MIVAVCDEDELAFIFGWIFDKNSEISSGTTFCSCLYFFVGLSVGNHGR